MIKGCFLTDLQDVWPRIMHKLQHKISSRFTCALQGGLI